MPDRIGPRGYEWQHEVADIRELRKVTRGQDGAASVPRREMGKLRAQECGLQLAQTRVEARVFVLIANFRTVVAQMAQLVGELRVVRRHGTGVRQRAEIFAGIKTDRKSVV